MVAGEAWPREAALPHPLRSSGMSVARSVILPCWPGASVLPFGLSWISASAALNLGQGTHTAPWQKGSTISLLRLEADVHSNLFSWVPVCPGFTTSRLNFPSQLLALLAPAFSSDEEAMALRRLLNQLLQLCKDQFLYLIFYSSSFICDSPFLIKPWHAYGLNRALIELKVE